MGKPRKIIFQSTYMISNASMMGSLKIIFTRKLNQVAIVGQVGQPARIGDNPRDLV